MTFLLSLQVVEAIKKILYAVDDSAMVIEEAQAMLLEKQNTQSSEDALKQETLKRKSIDNLDVDIAASTILTPRQRLSDVSDVHHSGSPVSTC